jgi:hypothetical protein
MSKFKMKLKVTGFELEIEGDRQDVPLIARNVSAQLGAMVQPANDIAQGTAPRLGRDAIDVTPTPTPEGTSSKKSRGRPRKGSPGASSATELDAFDWSHDVASWGNALQSWNTLQKSVWLLYVMDKQNVAKDASAAQIANTFNKHFRQAKPILAANVSRDLGKAKSTPPAKVGEQTTSDPHKWFLTEEGLKLAAELVKAARGETAA